MRPMQEAMDCNRDDFESGTSSCTSSISSFNMRELENSVTNSLLLWKEPDVGNTSSGYSNNVDTFFNDYPSGLENDFPFYSGTERHNLKGYKTGSYPTFCKKHHFGLRFFCNECCLSLCEECVLSDHITCDFKPLECYLERLVETVVEEDRCDFERLLRTVTTNQKSFGKKIEFIKDKINKTIGQIHFEIEQNRRELFGKLDYIEKFKGESWDFQIRMCEEALKKLSSHPKISTGSDLEDISVFREMLFAAFGDSCDFIEDSNINFVDERFPQFNIGQIETSPSPKHSVLVKPLQSLVNELNICTVIIRDYLNRNVSDSDYVIDVKLTGVEDKNPIYLVIENQNNGSYKIKYYPLTKGKYILMVRLNFVPIKGSPCELYVTENEEYINSQNTRFTFGAIKSDGEELHRPWGICSDDEGRLLVVDRGHHCVKIYMENGKFLTKFGKEGTGPGEFIKPSGITVDQQLRHIIVVDKDNHRIQVFNYEGSYLFHFGKEGVDNGLFFYPWDVSVNQKSEIAVSDSKNSRIQLFNEKGDFITKFCFDENQEKHVDIPRGVAFTLDGSLLITNFSKHCIVLLDKNFETARVMGAKGSDVGRFQRPQGIAVSHEGRIAVADGKNNRLQVFQSDGEILKIFGNTGNKIGELDTPQDITFLRDGRIVFTELGNHRVQVLDFP